VQRSVGEASPLVVEALGDAQSGVDRVSGIVRDLQSFSAAADTPHEIIDPVATVDSALTLVRNELRHRARIVRDYGVVPPVEASPARLGQVVLNLLVNAGQAIATGDAERNEIRVSVALVEGQVEIAVTDSGRGIAPDDLERVFEPFFTTRPLGQGAGLGLSICHDHVMRMGGTIDVHSSPDRGATFRVRLPAAAAMPATLEFEMPAQPLAILVVDDNPAVARAMSRILDGHRVEVALDAETAAERLTLRHFDAVVCDVMMPNEGGLALHAQVRTRDPMLADRFVFVSGGVFETGVRDSLAALGNPVVDKPISASELAQALARVTGIARHSHTG
jgi:CheY-like chemotaxis protein